MEDVGPDPFGGPTHEAIVECLARTVDRRRVHPAAARLQDMYDAADHAPIIDTGLAPRIRRKMRRKPRELPIT